MKVYRITRAAYSNDLSGLGAKMYGGRWNEKGVAVVYICEHKSLSILELLVHTPKQFKPPKYVILTIEIPDKIFSSIKNYEAGELPKDWDKPLANKRTKAWGTEKIRVHQVLGFSVPSVILKSEKNIVLNPNYKAFKHIKIIGQENFSFDERLLK